MIAVIVVNYRRATDTRECLESVLASTGCKYQIILVDNAPEASSEGLALLEFIAAHPQIRYLKLPVNAGFAGACNRALDLVLVDSRFSSVMLLNNDAVLAPGALLALKGALAGAPPPGMAAARMIDYTSGEVDSLGVTLFGCGLAANRKSDSEPLLGPCGGAAALDCGMLRDLLQRTGEVFDERYFCYAEDTDLALRARLLGYRAVYAPDAVVRHKGSQTSGGSDSDFVMYHGLRNSLVTLQKAMPAGFLLRHGWKLLLVIAAVAVKYTRQRRFSLLLRVARDAAAMSAGTLQRRRLLRRSGLLQWRQIQPLVQPSVYNRDYIGSQWRNLWQRRRSG